ncbi:hypothetical protein ABIB44_001119 [Hymenobacter sp. UYCo722]
MLGFALCVNLTAPLPGTAPLQKRGGTGNAIDKNR